MTRAVALILVAALSFSCSGNEEPQAASSPAQRVVTFAPHLAEMMFVVGAGEQLVGVSAWSDFPREVLDLPMVGDAFMIDQEQLTLLQPDLVLTWESGMPAHTIDELRQRGLRVEVIRTRNLADVANALRRVGELTGRKAAGDEAAARFTAAFDELRAAHRDDRPIDVFFQVSARPLYTVNREHFISEIIAICGGRNIFDDLDEFAPAVDAEAVVDRDPEVMLAGANLGDEAFAVWERWPQLAANRYGNQFLLPDETIGRPSPRLVLAGRSLCLALERGRSNRERGQRRRGQ